MKREDLRVECAAIMGYDGIAYSLPRPARHNDVIQHMVALGHPTPISGEQGFLLNDGRFVRRKAAAYVAIRNGQCDKVELPGIGLLSQDLW